MSRFSSSCSTPLLSPVLPDRYQLIDFGNGRKLESLAGRLVDRPCPAAEHAAPRTPDIWQDADSRFDLETRSWHHRTSWPDALSIEVGDDKVATADADVVDGQTDLKPEIATLRLPVHPTPFGHIGVFPEQTENWRWLMKTAPASDAPTRGNQRQALNLFAYTGASTLAMARSGMHVAHVDAAKPNVESAKRVAAINGLQSAPIRYLVDDAVAFVQRELRRGNRYHTIVLDPPAYGHGPGKKRSAKKTEKRPAKQAQAWRIERDLPALLNNSFDLLTGRFFRMLVTGHSAEMDEADVTELMKKNLRGRRIGRLQPHFETGRMSLTDSAGRKLDAGFFVRCWLNADS
jgi:23S rRNA (cytosine1962-C5)-methyltransferase